MADQLQLPFRSLDFTDRRALAVAEVAGRIGMSVQQVLDLISEGGLVAINIGSVGATRPTYRIPIESYREFIVLRLSGPRRTELLRQLPRPALEELLRDLSRILAA